MIATSRISRIAPPAPAPPATTGNVPDDAEMSEADVAKTKTENLHDAVLPLASRARYVTLCTPIEMLPESKRWVDIKRKQP